MTDAFSVEEQRAWETAPESPVVLDNIYNKVDRLYYEVARSCGLSSCAF